ncbi:ligase-associated DNA damage response exonuclease [Riemerella columbina]|uniref:ligase-associated DNA damage response exonuclease n=1 Tax=Riemerella columbina TaxID=103810 RepID=UPI000379B3A0|nr:ligase-associated DNA damage response exonuclease [Riemerella columbina]
MKKFIKFTDKGIYCIPGKFYLDPWKPINHAIISHAHADHARWGMKKYLCHHYILPILKHHIGKDINVSSIDYDELIIINGVKVSLHPAGHLVGSSQIRMEYKGQVIVFSGDYKVDADGMSTPFEPVKCDIFITESTFGLPIYEWKKNEVYRQTLHDWIEKNQQNQKTSILISYSLGKAQRIMKLVEGFGKIFVHNSIDHTNQAIAASDLQLPDYQRIDWQNRKEMQGQIVVVPPALIGSNMIKKIPNGTTAICSGWMQIRGNRRWKSVDAGFAISDHADWDGLIQAVRATEAQEVYVTHGSTHIFSKYLNEIGINAHELKTEYGDETEEPSENKE